MNITRGVMWVHYLYLLLLPATASFAAGMQGGEANVVALIVAGSVPVAWYVMSLAAGYTLPNSLPVALCVVLAVPLQIALSIRLFGGDALWLFFGESAAVEVGALLPALLLPKLRRSSGSERKLGMALLALVAACVVPFFVLVYDGYGGPSLWMLLFATAFYTALRSNQQLYGRAIEAHLESGDIQEVELRQDGGCLARMLGLGAARKAVRPFRKRRADERGWKPALLGLFFWILFMVAGPIGSQWRSSLP